MTVSELIQKLEEPMQSTAQAIVSGHCADWVEYKMLTARLRAFQEVVEMARGQPFKKKVEDE